MPAKAGIHSFDRFYCNWMDPACAGVTTHTFRRLSEEFESDARLHPLLNAIPRANLLRDAHQCDQQREHDDAEGAQLLK